MHFNKRIIRIVRTAGVLLLVTFVAAGFNGCGKKKMKYGDNDGIASGKVVFNDSGADISIDNIKAPLDSEIDYTSGINLDKGDGRYSVQVNASNVKTDTPGTYNVEYKFTYDGTDYTDNVKVTITDETTPAGDTDGGSNGDQVINESQGETSEVIPQETQQPQETSGTPNTNNEETTKKTLITGDDYVGIQDSDIPNAVIELLSGDVITIKCSTSKYIVATRTDESTIIRNGAHYKVSKLVVVFNTGAEQTLETIEKKID